MWKKEITHFARFLLCAFLLFGCAPLWSVQADAQQDLQNTLTQTSLSIKEKLLTLKKESEAMKIQLEDLSNSLTISENERTILEQQSMELSTSLTNINDSLNSSYETITVLEQKLQIKNKVLFILIIILVLRTISIFIGYFLYAKGIKVPRWLDILL